jgi:methionine-gamma-lyase
MVKPFPSKTHIGNHMLHPETLMLNYGYDPQLSEGAVKPPVFLTSTFVFKTAEDGQDFFDYVLAGASPPREWAQAWSIRASTIPTAEIVEDRLSVYERTDRPPGCVPGHRVVRFRRPCLPQLGCRLVTHLLPPW